MEDIEKILYKTLYYFMVFLMLTMVTVIFIQVIARYIVHNSLTWSEEIGRYTFVWITFFGTALAVKERSHVALDILIKKLPTLLKKIITVVGYLLMISFSCVLAYAGWKMVMLGKNQISSALQIQMNYVYLALPLGSIFIILYLMKNLKEDLSKKEV